MTTRRSLINFTNKLLNFGHLRLDSLTKDNLEQARLDQVSARGAFVSPIYPIPECFHRSRHEEIFEALLGFAHELSCLSDPAENSVGYQYANGFYCSPDTEVLYTLVRTLKPRTILEIGCGNSTRISRQAIIDGKLNSKISCIDPYPRRDVTKYADQVELAPVEESQAANLIQDLQPGDILFIDTSHIVLPANDCAYIFCVLIPLVPAGVIVHIHDVFLPFEYPEHFVRTDARTWGEQYLVSVMLHGSSQWEALWPGYFLQKTMPDFGSHFPHLSSGMAQSLWLERK